VYVPLSCDLLDFDIRARSTRHSAPHLSDFMSALNVCNAPERGRALPNINHASKSPLTDYKILNVMVTKHEKALCSSCRKQLKQLDYAITEQLNLRVTRRMALDRSLGF
jgi:hypothetical protein